MGPKISSKCQKNSLRALSDNFFDQKIDFFLCPLWKWFFQWMLFQMTKRMNFGQRLWKFRLPPEAPSLVRVHGPNRNNKICYAHTYQHTNYTTLQSCATWNYAHSNRSGSWFWLCPVVRFFKSLQWVQDWKELYFSKKPKVSYFLVEYLLSHLDSEFGGRVNFAAKVKNTFTYWKFLLDPSSIDNNFP